MSKPKKTWLDLVHTILYDPTFVLLAMITAGLAGIFIPYWWWS